MDYLDAYLIKKILLLIPNEIKRIGKLSEVMKEIINNDFVLKNISKYGINKKSMNIYALTGNIKMLKYVIKKENKIPKNVIRIVAITGNLECLKYLINNLKKELTQTIKTELCTKVSQQGHIECLKFLKENNFLITENTTLRAAHYGHLDCLKYCLDNISQYIKLGHHICNHAVIRGNIECLKYACENGCMYDEYTFGIAATYGHIECLKYLHQIKCPSNSSLCMNAAEGGHLDCLKYLYHNNYPIQFNNKYELNSTIRCLLDNKNIECARYVYKKYTYKNQ
jgi:hypothetical protein